MISEITFIFAIGQSWLFFNCHYIKVQTTFSWIFRTPFFLPVFFQRLCSACEHKCVVGSLSENVIEYRFRLVWAEFKWLLCHIDGEDYHFVESIFPR